MNKSTGTKETKINLRRKEMKRIRGISILLSLILMLAACYQSKTPTGNNAPDNVLEELPLIDDTDIDKAILEEDGNLIAIEAQEDEPFAEGEEIDLAGVNDPLPEVNESELSTQAIKDSSGFMVYVFHNEGNEKPWKIIRVNMKTGKKSKIYEGKNRINSVAISGDGQKLVFAMKKSDNYEVYRLALPDGLKRITSTNYNEKHVSMSADGNTIVWQGEIGSDLQGIYIKEGSSRGFLSVATEQTYPSVSANGKVVAFVRKLNNGNEAVMLYNKLTGKFRKVFEAASGHTIKHPSVTNGADKVLWLHIGSKDVLKLKKLDGKVRNILRAPSDSLRHPSMTANGKFVSYSVRQNDGFNVQVKSIGSSLIAPITGNASATKENYGSYWQYVVEKQQQNNRANYNEFSSELPSWGEFSPLGTPTDAPTAPGTPLTEIVNGTTYDCTVTPFSLTDNPEKIVTFDPDPQILWVGALLQGKGYKDGIGSLKELPIRQRAPVTLSINLLTNNNTITVENPNNATVNQAIGKLIEKAEKAGLKSGSDISFTQKETHSVEQAALKMGVAAKYMGFSIKAQLNASRSADERTITAFFVQNMFTVSMTIPQTPESVFSDAFTQEILDEQIALGAIGADNVPTYVANIVYGRILKFSFTSTASEEKIKATLNATFKGLSASGELDLDAEQKKILEESEVGVVTIGGDDESARALIKSGDLRDFFKKDAPLTTAKPLSYTVRNLGDNSIAQITETTNYNVKECSARPVAETKIVTLPSTQISNFIPPHTRGDREFGGHGPDVFVSATLINRSTFLDVSVFMKAVETKSDFTTASGSKTFRIHNIEPGFRIKRIINDTSSSASYVDNDHGVDTLSLSSAELVREFLVVGDTSGNDAGTDTKVSVNFNPITVELEKIQ